MLFFVCKLVQASSLSLVLRKQRFFSVCNFSSLDFFFHITYIVPYITYKHRAINIVHFDFKHGEKFVK